MTNSLSKQEYAHRFDCESITFEAAANMFELMEISEPIYEDVVEPSYKKPTMEDDYRFGHSRKM